MNRPSLLVVFACVAALFLGAASRLPLSPVSGAIPSVSTTTFQERHKGSPATAARAEAEPQADMCGNDVARAVATYQIDKVGTVYELHAPDTAVLKLLPPRM